MDKVRAKRIDFSDDGVSLVSIPVDKVRAGDELSYNCSSLSFQSPWIRFARS